MSVAPTVAAVILAARGGDRLAGALASVAWADDRVVVDPAGRLGDGGVPPGTTVVADVAALPRATSAGWLLLLAEDEVATPALATAVGAATRTTPRAYRVGRELHGFGAVVAPAGASVRLAPRAWADVRLHAGLAPGLWVPGGRAGRLAAGLRVDAGESVAGAVDDLEADAAALAGVLRARDRSPRVAAAVGAAVVAGARVLCGRARPGPAARDPWGRWTLVVLAGYRPMVAYAKLWETRHAEAATLR